TLVRLVIGETEFSVNGIVVESDLVPFIDPAYNRTMVPLRMVTEALGAQVNWIEEIRTVTIAANGQFLSLQVDVSLPDDMGTPMIVNDRTFVPIAYIAQTLGADVRWDGDNGAVYIQQ
ncbi:MAG: copper amine oxidase N-terminal domain-containing protein, partial [Defluviitaleaceae bacterium]|nr:copper amine oxidase N-terminal domain-containing protein [Defluviitaleaceae bacterium]